MSYVLFREGGPAILQVHRKDGQTCLLMPWDTMFSEEQAGGANGAEGVGDLGRRRKKSLGVWWPHVPVCAQCLNFAGFHAEHPCRRLKVNSVQIPPVQIQGLGGGLVKTGLRWDFH